MGWRGRRVVRTRVTDRRESGTMVARAPVLFLADCLVRMSEPEPESASNEHVQTNLESRDDTSTGTTGIHVVK
jgi:hypothetical protein